MPIQEFSALDYMGVVVCAVVFGLILLVISVTCLNWCFILPDDELTKMELMGHKRRRRWGPRRLSYIEHHIKLRQEDDDAILSKARSAIH
ncbi:unnamed protein product [Bursaphelenchus xylophilus]|uniref:(pine wood nematode) hypothetical protein n=1 Tax=Bursaphelenchus xylophilus TaxID=6326 RepID=A0A1I7RK17_BURXY|nr:unnamed protein product [Bursaphelenchus xylophilus]CAG9131571.1 unnamed protein product [Bursaphelenchus xylophilus]